MMKALLFLSMLITWSLTAYAQDGLYESNQGPDITPLECGLQRPTPLSDYLGEKQWNNGLTQYRYDTNHDGFPDVQIFVPQGENRYPLFYSFDNTFDGQADITWIDKKRDGSCGDVQVYWYRGQNLPDNHRKES